MNILITGADGFIGKNLVTRLNELAEFKVSKFVRNDNDSHLTEKLSKAEIVIHLAGENRPEDEKEFQIGNTDLTNQLCKILKDQNRPVRLIMSSSSQAILDNPYGRSKLAAEGIVEEFSRHPGCSAVIFRLPGVFGKWCKPNYNSVVATFCHNVANDLPLTITDPKKIITLVYIDDVIDQIINLLRERKTDGLIRKTITPEYKVSISSLASQIKLFEASRNNLAIERVGTDFTRALYATYISYLPKNKFHYDILFHKDQRGTFVEILKTKDSGQFSFFTINPGKIRGGHYHHSKVEKFLVIKGKAKFAFKNIITNEFFEINASADNPKIIETIPGWSHNVTNDGDNEMIAILWANEVFDKKKPDTISSVI